MERGQESDEPTETKAESSSRNCQECGACLKLPIGGIGGSGSNASRSNILAMYGISGDEMQKCQGRGIQVVSSSEEELAASSRSPAPQGPVVEYFDQELLCMKRVIGGGEATLAEMQEGQNGFLEYKWPGGDWLISEVPNLVLKAPKNVLPEKPVKKAKSKAKGKAKAKALVAKKPAGKAAAKAASKAADNAPEPLAKGAAKAAASTSDSSELVLHNLRITKASKPPIGLT